VTDGGRIIVWIPTGDPGWTLPPAQPFDHGWLGGGRRTMHELAVAIACTGRRVEMRGEVAPPVLDELRGATGVGPELPAEPTALSAADTVIVYEGCEDPIIYGRLALSPVRVVMMILAPPGLFGWPFSAEWSPPDPQTVGLDEVGRPEQFRSAAALGFELWTHSLGIGDTIAAAGLEYRFLGNGQPAPYPDPPAARDIDVVTLANNRWGGLARPVTEELEGTGIHTVELPPVGHGEMLAAFGRARILVHPSRVEGHSRIGCEARAMGAVPVVLDSNPYAVGLDEAGGAVAVGSVGEMPGAVRALLADPGRLERLSSTAISTARRQVAWEPYIRRVEAALAGLSEDPARGARAAIGGRLAEREAEAEAELTRHKEWLTSVNGSMSWRLTAPARTAKGRLAAIRRR
jgi:hypothetical protein